MRTTNKDQKMRSAAVGHDQQQQQVSGPAVDCVVHQSQPLQARSSNSGTSVKRSDNISQSDYTHGDASSDKPNHAWTKTSASTAQLLLAPGQLTNAFAQKRDLPAMTTQSTANNTMKNETPMAPSTAASGAKRGMNNAGRRNHHTDNQSLSSVSPSAGQASSQGNTARAGKAKGVSTRASRRQTRQTEQRAVKDSSSIIQVHHQPGTSIEGASGMGSKTQLAGPALSVSNSTHNQITEGILKPVKQSCSEQGTMRTTRSKAKAKQQDVKVGTVAIGQAETSLSNGQSEQQMIQQQSPSCYDKTMNEQMEGDEDEELLEISVAEKQEKIVNLSSINLMAKTRLEHDISQPWPVAEESKMQSPNSLNSTLIAAIVAEKTGNQSFRINDSIDSLLENPLTTVIKQFQNLRTSAQLTGKNKPTIQQFLEKFEKEMQYLEDQYQQQQQAREEQMKLFEQHYGGKAPVDLQTKLGGIKTMAGYASNQFAPASNDQVHAAGGNHTAQQSQTAFVDTIMVQDTSTLGPMPHDQSNNSFVSAVHGPNNLVAGSVFGGATSEITHSEVYESYAFAQNSMLSFYPKNVRKILTRRKTTNSANTIMTELKDLKAPKHKLKMKKTMAKMQSLALCQMNMMQILLQKISRRSKVIRKQEKVVNDNLKRKRIYLERERFDLMSVLRKSLEVTEEREQAAAAQANHLAQKNKTRTGTASDLNNQCLSTSGTKYGTDQPLTQSIKGSTTALVYGEENTSMDGDLRKRMMSGADNCLSLAADSISNKVSPGKAMQIMEGSIMAQHPTPEPPCKQIVNNVVEKQNQQAAAEAQVKQAVNLSEIDDSFAHMSQHQQIDHPEGQNSQIAFYSHQPQIFAPTSLQGGNIKHQMQTPPKRLERQTQDQVYLGIQQQHNDGVAPQQSETPMFDYEQHHLAPLETPHNFTMKTQEAEVVGRRKMQSTQGKQQRKRKSNLLVTAAQQDNSNKSLCLGAGLSGPPPQLKLDDASVEGSFAIADLQNQSHIKTEHLADGNFSITIKKHNDLVSNAGTLNQSQLQLNNVGNNQKVAKNNGNASTASNTGAARKQKKIAGKSIAGSVKHQQKDQSIKQVIIEVPQAQQNSEAILMTGQEDENARMMQKSQLVEQKHDNQRKLSPLRNLAQEHQQQNATNPVQMHQGQMPLQFESHMDAYNFVGGLPGLNMVHSGADHPHMVDMQPDHFMMGGEPNHNQAHISQGIFGPGEVAAQMSSTPGGHFQPLVPSGQIAELAMHRSQSVMLPQQQQTPQQMYGVVHHDHDGLMDPIHQNNLAGQPPMGSFDQYHHFVNNVQAPGAGDGSHHGRAKQQTDVLNLNFFDESAQELSSIDHSAAAVDTYGYQAGPNPYEQAKRQYLKKQSQAVNNEGGVVGGRQEGGVQRGHAQVEQPSQHNNNQVVSSAYDRVNNFVSPMVVGLQQLSSEHTPIAKAENGQRHNITGGDNTPSHFMSGVEEAVAANQHAGLGRGTALAAAQHSLQAQDQQRRTQQQQLSVGRIIGGDPFNMSGASVQHHHRGAGQNTFGNTPAGLMSNGQPCMTDTHRQHLSVSGWHLEEPDHNDNHQHQQRSGDQIYQGLHPDHPYM